MANTDFSGEIFSVTGAKHVFDQSVTLSLTEKLTVISDHAGRVLTAMLKHEQAIIYFRKDVLISICDSKNTAHRMALYLCVILSKNGFFDNPNSLPRPS